MKHLYCAPKLMSDPENHTMQPLSYQLLLEQLTGQRNENTTVKTMNNA